jgi:hypothetical protein
LSVSNVLFRSGLDSGEAPQVPAGLQGVVDVAAASAAIELFAASGVNLTALPGVQSPVPNLAALGIVRFSASALTGQAVVGMSTTILRPTGTRGTSDVDWIAELANQYMGRFKLKLLRAGFELWSLAPVRVSGRLLVTAVSQPAFTPLVFKDEKGGTVAVWIELEISGPLKDGKGPSEGEIPQEGDLILF